MTQPEPFMCLLEAAEAMVKAYDDSFVDWWPQQIEDLREAVEELRPKTNPKKCPSCGQTDGPYKNFDRPRSNSLLQSGCPRCGSCL